MLEVRDLRVRFGETEVVAGVDLTVAPGEWLGVIGPNGAGKSTILNAIVGSVQPAAGTIRVSGELVHTLSRQDRARRIAGVPQRPVIPAGMHVFDYVVLGRSPHIPYLGSESSDDLKVVQQVLASLDLLELSTRTLDGLSGGELQRVVLARAIAQGSPLLLLDEPTSALDVGHQQQVLSLVDTMRRSGELTVVSALHDLTLAAQFCDRLLMVAGGAVVSEGHAVAVLTESTIREHYGASVKVLDDGEGGVFVIPVRDSLQESLPATMRLNHDR